MTASVGLWIGREFLENLKCLLYYLFVDLFLACGLGIEEEFIRGYRFDSQPALLSHPLARLTFVARAELSIEAFLLEPQNAALECQ